MICCTDIPEVCNYGSSAIYCEGPTEEQIALGVVPLDSLPASWWNWMWSKTNTATNCTRLAVGNILGELNNVLKGVGYTPDPTNQCQLYNAIFNIGHSVGTASVAGSIKSAGYNGYVCIDSSGYACANGLGNVAKLNTVQKTSVVAAINELKSTYDCCISALNACATSLNNAKAPKSHASSDTTYGVGNATNYGHVKLSDNFTSSGGAASCSIGASSQAVYCTYNCLNNAKAPKSHASSGTTYGVGNATNYGHVKLSDSCTLTNCSDTAVSQAALRLASCCRCLNACCAQYMSDLTLVRLPVIDRCWTYQCCLDGCLLGSVLCCGIYFQKWESYSSSSSPIICRGFRAWVAEANESAPYFSYTVIPILGGSALYNGTCYISIAGGIVPYLPTVAPCQCTPQWFYPIGGEPLNLLYCMSNNRDSEINYNILYRATGGVLCFYIKRF